MGRMAIVLALVISLAGFASAHEWEALSSGDTLDGWRVLSGEWTIEDGVITGTAQPDENNWLIYDAREFADFEIELEFQTPVPTNGGLQVRSHWLPALPLPDGVAASDAPRVMYGYQANVETRQRTGSGRLIDENGRGPLAEADMTAAKTLKQKTWNTMRVVARGGKIEVYLHDVLACSIEDEAFISGYVALQSFAMGMTEPAAVQYRNIRVKDYGRDETWKPLFNGENLDGWEIYGEEEWAVEDGAIIGRSGPKKSEGYLATEGSWADFRVRGDFQMLGEGNFGLFFHSSITLRENDGYPVIAGVQGEVEPSWPGSSGWIYESYQRGWLEEPNHKIMPAFALRPDEWNTIEIRAVGPHTNTWINGIRVLDHDDPKPLLTEGQFALQLHAGGVDGIQWKNLYVTE